MADSVSKNDLVFVTGYSPAYKPARICVPTLQKYTQEKGYPLLIHSYPELGLETSWCKIDSLIEALKSYNTVIWADADCQVLDFDFDVLSLPDNDLNFSRDNNGLCAGFMVLRGLRALSLLQAVKLVGRLTPATEARYGVYKMEQNTIKMLTESSTKWHYNLLSMALVSNPDFMCSASTWIHHHWASS